MQAMMYNKRVWIDQSDVDYIVHTLEQMLKAAGFTIESVAKKRFEPYGFTALWLLSESHLAIHTFPEHNKTYIELSSCVQKPYDTFKLIFNQTFTETTAA